MDTKILENVGFTKGEIRVYLALLELGETTTGPIIEKSGITGSKVYEILDKLIDKGLTSYIIKEKTKYFQAASPKRLLDYINKKESELTQQKHNIEKIIPSLESIQKEKQKIQSSQIFEGYRGIRTVLNLILETLKPKEEYYAFALGDQVNDKNVLTFILNHHQRRIKKGIKVKLIADSRKKEFTKFAKLKGLQLRYYDNPVPLGVFIFKDYVATLTFKDKPTAFLIKSQQIADSYKDFFINLWKNSKD